MKKRDSMKNVETINFKIYGKDITQLLRDLVMEGSVIKAWQIFISLSDTMSNRTDIFQEIIKGKKKFEGCNEFVLEDEIDFQYSEEELLRILSYTRSDENILMAKEKLGIALSLETIKLYQYNSLDMKSQSAWITEGGLFIQVPKAGHINTLDELYEQDLISSDNEGIMEQNWVKVSVSFLTGDVMIQAKNLTARQKISLEKYFEVNEMFKEDNIVFINGFGMASQERNRVVFHKDKYSL
jgi:hypothetical protein